MKENKYDDEIFFEKYSQMERSRQGLKGAGEWSELQKLLEAPFAPKALSICPVVWRQLFP